MRTAMEELINEIVKTNIEINFAPYLEKEKKQIIDAYKQGYSDLNYNLDCQPIKYYNETFKH